MIELTTLSDTHLRIPRDEWLDLIQREYLTDFIRSGGSAVKVVSGSDDDLRYVSARLADIAGQQNCFHVTMDPGRVDEAGRKPDLHRIDRFLFTILEKIDLRAWASSQARAYLAAAGIRLMPGRAMDDVDGIAADNGRDASDLLNQYNRELSGPLLRDPGMAVEFRTAITALVRAQLIPDTMSPTTEQVLLDWFRGKTVPGAASALKRVQTYDRISQSNARSVLQSLCHWLPKAGHDGLVVQLDFRPYEYKKLPKAQRDALLLARLRDAAGRNDSSGMLSMLQDPEMEREVSYSDHAYVQMLSSMRRFIDEIDLFDRFVLVILTTPAFYDHGSLRNYHNYDALQTRIGLEVRDARRGNPAASLVHLGGPQ